MRIGIVCYPTFGGSGVVATELGLEMASEGHSVHFISYSQPVRLDPYAANVFYHEVSVSNYPLFDYSPYELVLTSKLVSVVKNENLDILHVHYAIPHASAAYMAKQILAAEDIHIPIVCTLHGTDITLVGKDASFEPVITFAINESDAVTAVSDSLKADTLEYFNVKREIQVIPNFIDLKYFDSMKPNGIRDRYLPTGERLVMHLSNFRKVKRVEDVALIFAKIQEKVPSQLLLMGDGPERNNVEKMCRDLGIYDRIHFLGKTKKIEQFLVNADLFILSSETESFGLAALEAMAAGVPVISTNTGGLPEVNEHGFSGYLSDVGDIDSMAKNAISILASDEELAKFKANARIQALKFDLKKIVPQYEALYRSLILPLK